MRLPLALVLLLIGCSHDSNDPEPTTTGQRPETTSADTTAGMLEACEGPLAPIGDGGLFGSICFGSCSMTCDEICAAADLECVVAQVADSCWEGAPIFGADRATCSTPVELSPAVGRCFCASPAGGGVGTGGATGGTTGQSSTSGSSTTQDTTSTGEAQDVSDG